jgi:hypothetical protein
MVEIMATHADHESAGLRQADRLGPIHGGPGAQASDAPEFITVGLRSGEPCLYLANDSPFEKLFPETGDKTDGSFRITGGEVTR